MGVLDDAVTGRSRIADVGLSADGVEGLSADAHHLGDVVRRPCGLLAYATSGPELRRQRGALYRSAPRQPGPSNSYVTETSSPSAEAGNVQRLTDLAMHLATVSSDTVEPLRSTAETLSSAPIVK